MAAQQQLQGPDHRCGELTTISRYQIDFRTKKQKNLDTGFEREVRLVYREEQE